MRVAFLTSILVSLVLLLFQTGAAARREAFGANAVGAVMTGSAASVRVAGGGLIAFTRYRLQDSPLWSEIWVARPDGSHAVKVSHSAKAVEDDDAHFSPNGRWIVFHRCVPNAPCSVWIVRSDGRSQHRIAECAKPGGCNDAFPSFAPDGTHLVFVREWGSEKQGSIADNNQVDHSSIVETTLDGSHAVVLREFDNWRGGFEAPRLTPSGRLLLFRSYAWHPDRITPDALYVAPRTGGVAHRITPLKLWASGGEISPDGRNVLFRSTFVTGELTPGNAIYTVGIDGHGLRRLIPSSFSNYLITGSYSPDGRSIVYATNDGATTNPRGGTFADIFTLDLATRKRVQVTHSANLEGWPNWGIAPTTTSSTATTPHMSTTPT